MVNEPTEWLMHDGYNPGEYQVKQRLFGLFLSSIISTTVFAAGSAINPVLDDPFTFRLGATYMEPDGKISSTIKGNSTVDLSASDLGIEDGSTNPYFGFRWRFTDRWRLTFDYFGLDVDGSVRRDFGDFEFGDISASGFLAVDTSFKTDFYVTQVGYSFLKNERAELGAGLGLHVVNFDTSLKVSGGIGEKSDAIQSDSIDLTAPLPNILGYGTYAFTPKLSLGGSIGWFGLDYDQYSGNLVTLAAALEYRLTKHIGVGAGYNYVDMDLTIDKSNREDEYNLKYTGPVLYLSAGF
jgi:opacity protein-like surface antigen